jgi:hypothetical protein
MAKRLPNTFKLSTWAAHFSMIGEITSHAAFGPTRVRVRVRVSVMCVVIAYQALSSIPLVP